MAVAGVGLFTVVYPYQWYGQPTDYTLPVTALYFLGVITTFWCLFVAVANFKARNDPGGTVRLEVTKEGKTKVIEVSNDRLRQGLGGIGLLGSTPDGETPTQTNGPNTARSDGGAEVSHATSPPSGTATPQSTSDAEIMRDDEPAPQGDVYCGNCAHFSYVRTDDGLQPYCGLHGEAMDDMDACTQWEANN